MGATSSVEDKPAQDVKEAEPWLARVKDWLKEHATLALVLLVLLVLAASVGVSAKTHTFENVTRDSIVGLLTPLFMIALFLERAQEVFVSAWRDLGKEKKERDVTLAREAVAAAKAAQAAAKAAPSEEPEGTQTDPGNPDKDANKPAADLEKAENQLEQAENERAAYKYETRRMSFLGGLSAGVVISIVGVRVLSPLVAVTSDTDLSPVFNMIDIFLTGGLIGGGSDGIHKVTSLVTDTLDVTRDKVNERKDGQDKTSG